MPRRIISAYKILKEVVHESIDDNIIKLSAALAYYTVFALPSLLLLIIGLCSTVYGREAIEGSIFHEISNFVGPDFASQIQGALRKVSLRGDTFLATSVGVITLLIAATGIFGEIQDSINAIWGLKVNPKKGFVKVLINRLISFSIIVSLGFILLVSLVANAVMQIFLEKLKATFHDSFIDSLVIVDYCLLLIVTTILFGFIFKVLPDARIKWRDVLAGSTFTAVLFMMGKELITYYLKISISVNTYGAAGSIIVLLLWVYYSAIVLYIGAEFTQVYVRNRGRKIEPNRYAMWVEADFLVKRSNTEIGDKKILDEKKLIHEAEKSLKHSEKKVRVPRTKH